LKLINQTTSAGKEGELRTTMLFANHWSHETIVRGEQASQPARARFKAFWTQACERARISGGKQRTESADGKKRRRIRIDWLYTYSYISRVHTLKHFLLCFVVSLCIRGNNILKKKKKKLNGKN
jgi:hypothetical protein